MSLGFADLLVLQGVWLSGRKPQSAIKPSGPGGGPHGNPWKDLPPDRKPKDDEILGLVMLDGL